MELKSSPKLFTSLTLIWSALVLALGFWWLYLIIKLGEKVDGLTEENVTAKMITLAKWEGSTFLLLLVGLSTTLLFFYFKDMKKNHALSAFFSGVTHELKTPLASIRLQTEALIDLANASKNENLQKVTNRLVEDTINLETQMDKVLQLSRLERGGRLSVRVFPLQKKIKNLVTKFSHNLDVKWKLPNENLEALVDEYAIEVIIKNLLENTKRHSSGQSVSIELEKKDDYVVFTYCDQGQFKGDWKKLGTLFYKFNSAKGSGIGLYLIKGLMRALDGKARFNDKDGFCAKLYFKTPIREVL